MGIVQIIRRTYAEEIYSVALRQEQVVVSVEQFLFSEERSTWEVAVYDADRVVLVVCSPKLVTSLLNSFQMTRCNITANPYQYEVLHSFMLAIHCLRESDQYGTSKWNVSLNLVLSRTEYAGLFTGDGYSLLWQGKTRHEA